MNRKELARELAIKTDTSIADANRTIEAFIDIISSALKKDDKVALVGFGTFEVRKRAARTGRNPRTGAPLEIKASKQPTFKAGVALKTAINAQPRRRITYAVRKGAAWAKERASLCGTENSDQCASPK